MTFFIKFWQDLKLFDRIRFILIFFTISIIVFHEIYGSDDPSNNHEICKRQGDSIEE